MEKKADIVFEVSWEVCNKVGGIYTVVRSKAARMVEVYGNNYFLVGPYFGAMAVGQFQEELPEQFCKSPFEELKKLGIICHYGKWIVDGNPTVILIDFVNFKGKSNEIKKELWESYKIDSLRASRDYDEPVVFAYAAGMLIEMLSKCFDKKKIVAHFHEWLSGPGLLYLKKRNAMIGTVFTTHATVLGRTLASANVDLYNVWDKINPDEEIYRHNIESKHLVEKNSALFADSFTTVSEITGMEALHLLKKKPDVILPNGLDISKFPSFEEITIRHGFFRDKIKEFMLHYFFPYYNFDLKETLIYFLAGRYEFHDKGIDIYIRALGKLNERLKESKIGKKIIAFIWVPANIRNIRPELLENKTMFQRIKSAIEEVSPEVQKNILYSIISGNEISKETLFDETFLLEIKSSLSQFAKKGNPPLLTHDLYDENDAIIKSIISAELTNSKDDNVKIIYYPIYLSGADGLLNLGYYEAMQGSHLGIFPSYYEPWGYTPLEAGALGVSSVTTDLAGFGRYFCAECQKPQVPGIFVLKRLNKSDEEVTNQLVDVMFNFANLSKEERIANKLSAREAASMADWKIFVSNYIKAHNMAVEKVYY